MGQNTQVLIGPSDVGRSTDSSSLMVIKETLAQGDNLPERSVSTEKRGKRRYPGNSMTAKALGCRERDNRRFAILTVCGSGSLAAVRKATCCCRLGNAGLPIDSHNFSGE